MDFPQPATPVFARTSSLNTNPIEPDYNKGTYSFPLRILTVGEDQVIQTLQKNPPPDPYFPSLLTQPHHPGWLALARHHGHPTRLLDVTSNLDVALFFACKDHPNEDAFLLAYVAPWNPEKNNPGRVQHYQDLYDAALGDMIPTYRDQETTHPGTLDTQAKRLAHEAQTTPRRHIPYLFECNDVINERMVAQRGAFIWRGDPTLSLLEGLSNIFIFRIQSGAKSGIMKNLNILGTNAVSLRLP